MKVYIKYFKLSKKYCTFSKLFFADVEVTVYYLGRIDPNSPHGYSMNVLNLLMRKLNFIMFLKMISFVAKDVKLPHFVAHSI